jgi:hypothetical protein
MIIGRSLTPLNSSGTLRAVRRRETVPRGDDNSHRKAQNVRGDSSDVRHRLLRCVLQDAQHARAAARRHRQARVLADWKNSLQRTYSSPYRFAVPFFDDARYALP